VVYLGIDDHFLEQADAAPPPEGEGALRLMFAGRMERDKGAEELIGALGELPALDWRFTIAGPVAAEITGEHHEFLGEERVRLLGTVSRAELARQMKASHVFVFPSHAEGSARVIFEALACGCYVITTPNSGSIVEDGVNGALIAPGDRLALREAIESAASDRAGIAEIGARNAALVRERFRQSDYGDALAALYHRLARGEPSLAR
jgi:glycosyltransferase involved in cell wall biosynthesis